MKRSAFAMAAAAAAVLTVAAGAPLRAQVASGGSFVLDKARIASGGEAVSGAAWSAVVTTGQSEAQPASSGGPFELRGGFHVNAAPLPIALFSDGFEN